MDYASSKAKDNAWFERFGQLPPEVNMHLTEEEREAYRKNNLANHRCEYYQMGNRIICDTGDFEHGKIISLDLMLVETRDGVPILQKHVISS